VPSCLPSAAAASGPESPGDRDADGKGRGAGCWFRAVSSQARRLNCLVGLAEDGDDVADRGLQPARAEFGNPAASPDHVGRAPPDAGQPAAREVLIVGVAVGDQVPGEAGGQLAAMAPLRREAMACRSVSCGLVFLLRVRVFLLLRWGRRGNDSSIQNVHQSRIGGWHVLACQRRDHGVVEPGLDRTRPCRAATILARRLPQPSPEALTRSAARRTPHAVRRGDCHRTHKLTLRIHGKEKVYGSIP
jgi:hypothetical protein